MRSNSSRTGPRSALVAPVVGSLIVATSSAALLLLESDRLTVLSRHQISLELEVGLLAALDIDQPELQRRIVATLRRDWKPTQVQAALLEELKAVTREWRAADAASARASA